MLRTTQERIDFINLSTNTVQVMDYISDKQVVEIIYNFIKTKIMVIDLSQFILKITLTTRSLKLLLLRFRKKLKPTRTRKTFVSLS